MMNSEKSLVINQFNTLGEKLEFDYSILDKSTSLEQIIIKNFDVNNVLIQKLNNIKNLKHINWINCVFENDIKLDKGTTVEFNNCFNVNSAINNDIEKIFISDGERIDLKNFQNLNLKSLKIENTKVENMEVINTFLNLENIYLYKIDLTKYEIIDFSKFENLKKLKLDNSLVEDINEYIKNLNLDDIEFSFKDKKYETE